ncbi:related to RTM1 protein [Rhynchosporium agropyri]|uniref:Related to RTM1 protein n=1 Tax=Rhynchosporium agropyri TaxID=914238 RepID=A0A1E1KZA3_9HELO|nr:related to RTM1 protein [Rhynchosporium agropyri]
MASINEGPKVPITNWYDYEPALTPAIVFGILYTVAFVFTAFQFFRYKTWFWICMVIGGLMEAIGYVGHIFSVAKEGDKGLYILQFVMIFIAPAVMAAACYMAMGRVALHAAPKEFQTMKHLWIPPRYMTPLFVTCDIAAFVTQVMGGVDSTDKDIEVAKKGLDTMKIGLIIQLICFGFFLVISIRFHSVSKRFEQFWPDKQWPNFLWAINVAGTLIFVRCIYRLIEFSLGHDNYLITHEWNFYVFETCFILPVFFIFNWYHPARYLTNIGFRQERPDGEVASAYKWYSPAKYVPALRKNDGEKKEAQQTDVELSAANSWEDPEGTATPKGAKTSVV